MDQVLSLRFFFMPATCGASWSRFPPRTSGTQIFSTTFSSTAPSPVVGRVGGASAAGAAGCSVDGAVAAAGGAAGVGWPAAGADVAAGGAGAGVVVGAGAAGAGWAAGVWAWTAVETAAVRIRL